MFEALGSDVQSIMREWAGRKSQPTAICNDSRTLQSDTLGHLLALTVTPADKATAIKSARRPNRCNESPATRYSWPMWIRAISVRTPRKPHNNTKSGQKW